MKRKKSAPPHRRTPPPRTPDFESGVFPEPHILFGGGHWHVDPKVGLTLYGPYSPAGDDRPLLQSIQVGMVGPANMIANAEQWINACRGQLTNDGGDPFGRPYFPGLNNGAPFQCELRVDPTWHEQIRPQDIAAALVESDPKTRIHNIVSLYVQAIETLSGREPKPSVILCCIPDNVIDQCTRVAAMIKAGERVAKIGAKQRLRGIHPNQLSLFADLEPRLPIEDESAGHNNLRRGLKAQAMQFGIPTQIVWPRTLQIAASKQLPGQRALQDIATRAWNFTTAMYHKAGGSPWRLESLSPDVCYVGISFYRELRESNPRLRTSMAQAFTAAGDGYVLQGNAIEWDETKGDRSPHLDRKSAASLLRDVLDLYQRQNKRSLPGRVVLHKSSRFSPEELDGFEEACELVPQHDFVAFGRRDIQFYRSGAYPPVRGTFIRYSDTDFSLYTDGYIPYLKTYPGARVPRPIDIIEHHGDSPWTLVLQEVLALTKMNWNTADFACSMPITLAFSHRVGEILAELPSQFQPRPEYRFYM